MNRQGYMCLMGMRNRDFTVENEIRSVYVQIVRFLDSHNPGVIECKLVDVEGFMHTFIDKVPIFTTELPDENSAYPQTGRLRCRAMAEWQDAKGRSLVRINTLWPDGIESAEGASEFVVTSQQMG